MNVRIGVGYDVHRLVEGRPLVLGGVTIPHHRGLLGHSDADVLLHAIADAVLGAAALGDIGHHFPDTDEAWRDADSIELLHAVRQKVAAVGYAVNNVDATIVIERPKLQGHIEAMQTNVADALELRMNQVSVKATTSERMGFVGTHEGAAVYAVCTLVSQTKE